MPECGAGEGCKAKCRAEEQGAEQGAWRRSREQSEVLECVPDKRQEWGIGEGHRSRENKQMQKQGALAGFRREV